MQRLLLHVCRVPRALLRSHPHPAALEPIRLPTDVSARASTPPGAATSTCGGGSDTDDGRLRGRLRGRDGWRCVWRIRRARVPKRLRSRRRVGADGVRQPLSHGQEDLREHRRRAAPVFAAGRARECRTSVTSIVRMGRGLGGRHVTGRVRRGCGAAAVLMHRTRTRAQRARVGKCAQCRGADESQHE